MIPARSRRVLETGIAAADPWAGGVI